MIENGAGYSSRQWMLISFLAVMILASIVLITQYSGLGYSISMLASGKQIKYIDTVEFPDIEDLNGLFPDTDNTTITSEVDGLINTIELSTITPTLDLLTATPTVTIKSVTQTPKPAPTRIPVTPTYTNTPIPTTIGARDYSIPWPVAPGCPTSTLNCVPCTSGTYCRFETGETHGFLGWSCQNNNPGNIRPATFKDEIIVRNGGVASCGIRYDSRGGSYMVFSDYNSGFNGLKAYLRGISNGEHSSYQDTVNGIYCGDCSLRFFAEKYSANYSTYANNLGNYLGVNPDTTTLRTLVETRLDDLARGIQHVEGFYTQ
jgi:hypothetical protein